MQQGLQLQKNIHLLANGLQHNQIQLLRLDILRGAGLRSKLDVLRAFVVIIVLIAFVAIGPYILNYTTAVCASQHRSIGIWPFRKARISSKGFLGLPGAFVVQGLNGFPKLHTDNRLMGTVDHIPLRRILLVKRDSLVQAGTSLALGQVSDVDHVQKQILQHMAIPGQFAALLVIVGDDPSLETKPPGRGIALFVQCAAQAFDADAGGPQLEYLFYDGCNFWINDEAAGVFGISQISIRLIGTDKVSAPPLCLHSGTDLSGNILCVGIVHQVLQGCRQLVRSVDTAAVIIVVDRNETNAQKWEYPFQIITGLNIVTAQSRQILRNDAVDLALAGIIHHALEGRSVKVSTCTAVVYIGFNQLQERALSNVALKQSLLIFQRVSILFAVVLQR